MALRHPLPRRAEGPWLDELVVRSLARAAGVTAYELAMRLRVLDGHSGVLTTFAGREPAEATAAALTSGGVRSWVMRGRVEPAVAEVRRFSLDDGQLRVWLDGGAELEMAAPDVRMLLHGVRHRERPVPRAMPLASAGSWAGPLLGLSTTSAVGHRPSPEPFLRAYVPGRPVLAFHAATLRYGDLDEAIAPTRAVNFQRVVTRLRHGCPAARYDGRLRRWTEQTRVLGPTLRPERYLELAISLVVGADDGPRSPYR